MDKVIKGYIHYPYVRIKGSNLSGLMYTGRDGVRALFDGNAWSSLLPGTEVEIGLLKDGCINKMIDYYNHVNNS